MPRASWNTVRSPAHMSGASPRQEIEDLYDLRELIEPYAAARARSRSAATKSGGWSGSASVLTRCPSALRVGKWRVGLRRAGGTGLDAGPGVPSDDPRRLPQPRGGRDVRASRRAADRLPPQQRGDLAGAPATSSAPASSTWPSSPRSVRATRTARRHMHTHLLNARPADARRSGPVQDTEGSFHA